MIDVNFTKKNKQIYHYYSCIEASVDLVYVFDMIQRHFPVVFIHEFHVIFCDKTIIVGKK